jgi:hypothetical protein
MAKKRRISDQAIQLALQNSLGFRSMAAHSLGISPATLRRRLKENPQLASTAAALNSRQDTLVKVALGKRALEGDFKAIIYWVTTHCGWTTRSARPRKTPWKITYDPNATIGLITSDGAVTLVGTGGQVSAPGKKRKSRS